MPPIDTKKLDELLEAKKFDEARVLLSQFLQGDLSEEEKAALHLSYAETYMRVMNSINRQYREALQGVASMLQEIDKKERSVEDSLKLKSVRQNLAV